LLHVAGGFGHANGLQVQYLDMMAPSEYREPGQHVTVYYGPGGSEEHGDARLLG